MKYTPTQFQKTLYGISGQVFIKSTNGMGAHNLPRALDILLKLAQSGYNVANADEVIQYGNFKLDALQHQLQPVLDSYTIDTYKFRYSFATSTELEEYKPDEWLVIFAQYAMTYGWVDTYKSIVDMDPAEILSKYGEHHLTQSDIVPLKSDKMKDITITFNPSDYIKSIIESKIPLRQNQIELLEQAPVQYLQGNFSYSIKSTEALVNNILYSKGYTPNIASLDSLMRFILSNCQKGNNGENYDQQITKPMLKSFKFHIPTRMKKFIWSWLDTTAMKKDYHWVAEQMFTYEQWWKRCLHHCHYTNKLAFELRYPAAHLTLKLLYSSDRSWTFNSRYSTALASNDYAKAIEVLSEKPGLLFRNLVMYCKYVQGAALPVKESANRITNTTDLLFNKPKIIRVQSDAINWLQNMLPTYLAKHKPTIKTLWQVCEELISPAHEEPVHERIVQGQTIRYSTPIPAIDKSTRDHVVSTIMSYIKSIKIADNESLGKVYIDPALSDIAIQYSGNESNETSCSGQFYTPGSSISIPEGTEFIRLGIAWKDIGHGSCDIDLSTTAYTPNRTKTCYYGSPELKNTKGKLIAVSSGDITSCSSDLYSAEFIDIDIARAKEADIKYFINELRMYSGNTFDKYDTHVFMTAITASERTMPGSKVKIDLSKQDYAVKINDPARNYISSMYDVVNDKLQVLSIAQDSPLYSSMRTDLASVEKAISQMPSRPKLYETLAYCLSPDQLVLSPDMADISIGLSPEYDINPATNMEAIQQVIF